MFNLHVLHGKTHLRIPNKPPAGMDYGGAKTLPVLCVIFETRSTIHRRYSIQNEISFTIS